MEVSRDLLRVVWHEMGHLCIDIAATDKNKEYKIDEVWFRYHAARRSRERWAGAVVTVPPIKFELLIEDDDKTSFAFIDLISGCIFQTLYYKEIEKENISLDRCFGFKNDCAGYGDCLTFNAIGSEYRKKFGNREDFTNFVNIELIDIYYAKITDNKQFLKGLTELTIKYRDVILNKYEISKSKERFSYHITGEELVNLVQEYRKLLEDTGFYWQILDLKEMLYAKIAHDKRT